MGKEADELTLLEAEYTRLTAEIQSRYLHHYYFHYLALVVLGAAIALLAKDGISPTVLLAVFLVGPLVFLAVILLMLKEHAYMDLREHYIDRVLRPRAETLLGGAGSARRGRSPFAWYRWEKAAVRDLGANRALFGLFGAAEYLLPLILSAGSLFGAWTLLRVHWSAVAELLFAVDCVVALFGLLLVVLLRSRQPHLRGLAAAREEGEERSGAGGAAGPADQIDRAGP